MQCKFLKFINGRDMVQIPLEGGFLGVQAKLTFVTSGLCLYMLSYFCTHVYIDTFRNSTYCFLSKWYVPL